MVLGKKKLAGVTSVVTTMTGLALFYFFPAPICSGPGHVYERNTSHVVVASTAIGKGAALQEEDVEIREVPTQFLPNNPLLDSDLSLYIGQSLEAAVNEGAMLLTSDFTSQ